LHAHRLDDAEKFFAELQNSKVRAYAMLGKFGQAVVLAHRNRAQDSNRLFLELLGAKALVNPERERLLLDQAQLRAEIAEALDFNKANATAALPFPEELDVWRVPPANTRKGSPDHSNPRNKNGTPPAK
jgi:cytosine/adenosine deaminase-related metal-dependent hydrolase